MNYPLIRRLIVKDWYFQRGPIAGYTAGALLGLGIICLGTPWSFYAGTILIITFLITLGIHVTVLTVVNERTEQTLPFLMSLPISPKEYTTAKVLANLSIFLLPWVLLTGGTAFIFGLPGARSGAMVPLALLVLGYILAAYTLVLSAAIITESLGWTICAMAVTNLFLQFFLYWVSSLPAIARGMTGHGAVWARATIALLLAEAAVCVLAIGIAFLFQARRRDLL